MKWPSDDTLKQLNRGLLVIIILANVFTLGSPLLPTVKYQISSLALSGSLQTSDWLSSVDTSYNHIVIPSMRLDETIHEGEDITTANLGVWRRPNTSKPGKGNNTVMVGHRFTYDGKSVFYHLDKVKPGQTIAVAWQGKLYVYEASHSFVAPATAVEIEGPTRHERLTLYTCTPLWSAKDRLVVTADLVEVIK